MKKSPYNKAVKWLSAAHFTTDTYSGFLHPIMPFIAAKIGISMGVCMFVGTYVAKHFIKKVEKGKFQKYVSVLLIIVGLYMLVKYLNSFEAIFPPLIQFVIPDIEKNKEGAN